MTDEFETFFYDGGLDDGYEAGNEGSCTELPPVTVGGNQQALVDAVSAIAPEVQMPHEDDVESL